MKIRILSTLIFSLLIFSRCQKDDIGGQDQVRTLDGRIAIEYMEFIRDLVKKTAGFSPPVAGRVFGYAGLTLYESVVGGINDKQSLIGQVNGLNELPKPSVTLHWGQVANSAMSRVVELYFPAIPYRSFDEAADEAAISRLYGSIHFRDAIELGIKQGNKVGDEILSLKFNK
ncbi:MAG: hypothetical protein ABI761_07005 [Saprospiraceae bacterium]